MHRRQFLKVTSGALAGVVSTGACDGSSVPAMTVESGWVTPEARPGLPAVAKPNVILIVSDQHRAGLSRREGYPLDTCPALDRLSASGIAFDRA